MSTLSQVFGLDENFRTTKTYQDDLRKVGFGSAATLFSERCVGVEIEIEKVTNHSDHNPNFAYTEQDGSLKDNGLEIISYPLAGNNIDFFIGDISRVLNTTLKGATFTRRCSMHVHVNVRDFTKDEIVALVASYLCMENLFFNEVTELRRNSAYCSALGDVMLARNNLFNTGYLNGLKYYALNPGPIRSYGTVEFRHHQGTKDPDEMMAWIFLCQSFVDNVKKIGYNDLRSLILRLNTVSNYSHFISLFWGNQHPWINKDLQSLISPCVGAAKKVIR